MKGLRIGWAAPWDEDSTIALSAAQIAFELSRVGHSVTVLRTEVGQALDRLPRLAPGPVHALADISALELRQNFDVLVAHIGDSFDFHGAVLRRLAEVDFVGIFYDSCVAALIREWGETDPIAICDLSWQVRQPCETGARRRQMLEGLAGRMVGAVAHIEHCARRLQEACPGPVVMIPLAFTALELPPPPSAWSHMIIGLVGWTTAHDRIDQLILAIAASPILRGCCRIKIMGGAPEYERARLDGFARSLRVKPPTFTGYLPSDELRWQIRDVDVVACFDPRLGRGPTLSVLAEISGRPILVTSHDCYSDVPDNNMLVCETGHLARDVVWHLERLLHDRCRGTGISERSRNLALCRHSPQAYTRSLLFLLEEVVARQPEHVARRNLLNTLVEFGLPPNDPAVTRVEAVLASLVKGQ